MKMFTKLSLPLLLATSLTHSVNGQTGNWSSLGSSLGANGPVYATAVDGAGNLYIGGAFTSVAGVTANGIAKWDGSSWSALGSGLDGLVFNVFALAVSGSDVYAGGTF